MAYLEKASIIHRGWFRLPLFWITTAPLFQISLRVIACSPPISPSKVVSLSLNFVFWKTMFCRWFWHGWTPPWNGRPRTQESPNQMVSHRNNAKTNLLPQNVSPFFDGLIDCKYPRFQRCLGFWNSFARNLWERWSPISRTDQHASPRQNCRPELSTSASKEHSGTHRRSHETMLAHPTQGTSRFCPNCRRTFKACRTASTESAPQILEWSTQNSKEGQTTHRSKRKGWQESKGPKDFNSFIAPNLLPRTSTAEQFGQELGTFNQETQRKEGHPRTWKRWRLKGKEEEKEGQDANNKTLES